MHNARELFLKQVSSQLQGADREMDVRLTMVREGATRWKILALKHPHEERPLTTTVDIHPLHPLVTVTIDNIGQGYTNSKLQDNDDDWPKCK